MIKRLIRRIKKDGSTVLFYVSVCDFSDRVFSIVSADFNRNGTPRKHIYVSVFNNHSGQTVVNTFYI